MAAAGSVSGRDSGVPSAYKDARVAVRRGPHDADTSVREQCYGLFGIADHQ